MKRHRPPHRQPRGPRATLPPRPPRAPMPDAQDIHFWGTGCEYCGRRRDECRCWCPCGHEMDSDLRCLNGSEHCDGPCTDTYGTCNANVCRCEEDDDDA